MVLAEQSLPIILNYQDGYDFEFPGLSCYAIIASLHETSGKTLTGELSIQHPIGTILLTDARLNLSFNSDRDNLIKQLYKLTDNQLYESSAYFVWEDIIQCICTETITRYRKAKKEKAGKGWINLNDVAVEDIRWLWYPYIPLDKVTMLEGDPGIGKSWISLAIATAASLGTMLPGQDVTPDGPVLLASAEDGLGDTIKPRLINMGANLNFINAIEDLLTLDETGFETLESYIFETVPILLIIDPLVAYFSGDLDINKANAVRWGTSRLAKLANKYGMAIIAVRHLTKGGSLKPIYRGLGSIDFTASARSVLLAGTDTEDTNKRGIVHIKSNLEKTGESIGYDLRDGGFFWNGRCDLTPERILGSKDEKSGKIQDCVDFIRDYLSYGPATWDDIVNAGSDFGSEGTLRIARKKITELKNIKQGKKGKRGGPNSLWTIDSDLFANEK